MNRIYILLTVAMMHAGTATASETKPLQINHDIHISPEGSDENPGTLGAPVLTIEKARQMRQLLHKSNQTGLINIYLHPGIYMIRETVNFKSDDSGTKEKPLNIIAWKDPAHPEAPPVLTGGVMIRDWKKCNNFNGRSDVYEADLKDLNIKRKFKQIFLNGTRQILARYPNLDPSHPYSGGWAYTDGVRPPMYKDIEGESTDTVVLRKKDSRQWSRPTDGEVCIFPRYNWWNRIEIIKGFDSQSRTITLERKMPYAARPEDRFCVMGMKEELDSPGEWYQDNDNHKLYFIPPPGTDLSKAVITVPTVDTILHLDKTDHVRISGLEFTCSEQNAIKLSNCAEVIVEKCLIHDLGYFNGAGITINSGRDCIIRGCDVWHIGGHGVSVDGGNKVNLEPCNHVVDNCYIHHIGQFNRHGIGVMLSGVGIRVSHNLIHDTPRCGVFHGGAFNMLEFNRIRHCNLEMEDTGCTYTGGWTGGWHTIRYNHCTDSIGFNNHGKFFVFAWGIYLDESGCGNDVYGNIVERCQVGAMHLHNARENHIYNNIFANNAGPEGKTHQLSLQTWNNDPNAAFMTDRQPKMLKDYEELMTNPIWAKMRGMHISPKEPFLPDGTIMRGNMIERNIFYYPKQPESRYIRENGVNLQYNIIDYNTVWNGGETPVKTGKHGFKKALADLTGKIPNVDFSKTLTPEEITKTSNNTIADGWYWYHKTFPDMKAEIITTDGKNILRLPGAFNSEKQYIKNTCIKSSEFSLEQGKNYRLSFKMKNKDATGELTARFVCESKGLWKAFGSGNFLKKSDMADINTSVEKFDCQTSFYLPKPGDSDYDDRLDSLTLHFQFNSSQGWVEISNILLEEVERMTEWESWQNEGADVHSVVADPLFVDPENGNFNLKHESPALKLGFKPIPYDKIGPYKDVTRATWPIIEANGVRENPQWLESVPMD